MSLRMLGCSSALVAASVNLLDSSGFSDLVALVPSILADLSCPTPVRSSCSPSSTLSNSKQQSQIHFRTLDSSDDALPPLLLLLLWHSSVLVRYTQQLTLLFFLVCFHHSSSFMEFLDRRLFPTVNSSPFVSKDIMAYFRSLLYHAFNHYFCLMTCYYTPLFT